MRIKGGSGNPRRTSHMLPLLPSGPDGVCKDKSRRAEPHLPLLVVVFLHGGNQKHFKAWQNHISSLDSFWEEIMTRYLKTYRTLLLALALIMAAWQSPAKASLTLLNFQAAGMAVYPSGATSQFFPQVSWTPYLKLESIGVRGEIGITFLKNSAPTADRFLAINYEVLASMELIPAFSIEVGGGFHNWVNSAGMGLAGTANLVFWTAAGLDRVFIGYSRFFKGGDVNELRLGVGFAL